VPFNKPSLEFLTVGDRNPVMAKEEDLLVSAQHLEKTLADFNVQGKVVEIHPGPIITRFDFAPAPGIKVQAVASLANDIALAMKAMSVRVVAPIPGKADVGIELPNPKRAIVRLREVLESTEFQMHPSKLALGLGKDAEGHPVVADLASMPHLLIAGSTGAGKSVCIHALIMSLIYRSTPDQVKMLLIDPKRLELPLYNGIPYLFDPNQNPENCRVITDPKEAAKALEGVIKVMDHRFKKFANAMARDISHYNEKMSAEGIAPEPYIVVIIDELADLMAVAAKEVEVSIQRLAQMARAVGIHLVLATQRPSVDVITGVIKANLPARIAFRVASQTDSRVILDTMGAESLLGQGDMLFLPPGDPKPSRLQCGLVTTKEVQTIADFTRAQGAPSYERILSPTSSARGPEGEGGEELDDLQQALMLVLERKRVSQDLLKAHFGSSARATDLLSQLEIKGFIEKPEGTNRWTIYFDRIDAYLGQIKSQSTINS
jgi:S-DNA-T family DNA segregation ATPase FtsK/SpoIIIE